MPIDKSPIVIKEFKGKLVTDVDPLDTVLGEHDQPKIPFEYALESINLDYLKKGGLRTRCGIDKYETQNVVGKPIAMWKVENLNNVPQTDRWIIATKDAGNIIRLYDTQSSIGNPIFTAGGTNYHVVGINAFGRMYFTFWVAFLSPQPVTLGVGPVIVYTGAYAARSAKAVEPNPAGPPAMAVAVAAGGNCTPGVHYISVLYETDTGYISECPNAHLLTPLTATTTAANATINGTNVPLGPAGSGVIKRHIIITKIVVNPPALGSPAAGFRSFEPFIAVTINDNTTTTFTFNSPDSALLETAKNYIENGEDISNCVGFGVFGNRMVYLGPTGSVTGTPSNKIWVSPPNRPEQIMTLPNSKSGSPPADTTSTIYIGQDFSGRITAGYELNSVFYVFKEDSVFAIVAENDKDPGEWADPILIDSGKGAFPFGIAKIGNSPSSNNDGTLLVAGRQGLSYFNGKFDQRSLAEGIWEEYKEADLKWIKIVADPLRQILFARVGDPNTDNLTAPHGANLSILMANYYYGTDITSIRWGEWKYLVDHTGAALLTIVDIDLREPGSVGNDGAGVNYNALYSLLCLLCRFDLTGGNFNARIYSEALEDRDFLTPLGVNGVFPVWQYDTGFTPNKNGEIYNFGPLKLRVTVHAGGATGNVNNNISVYKSKLDSTVMNLLATFAVTTFPGKYYSLNMNETGEHIRLRMTGQNRVFIDTLILNITAIAQDRPRV